MGAEGIREFIKWYLPADPQGGAGRRRPLQWRRQRVADAHRAAEARATGHRLRPDQRHPLDLSRRGVPRPPGLHAQSEFRLRRRHLPGDVQAGEARPADRQAIVGRRGRHHQSRPAGRRRRGQCPRVRLRLRRRPLDHRGPRRRSRHRSRERPEVGDRRARPPTRTGRRGGDEEGSRTTEATARSTRRRR